MKTSEGKPAARRNAAKDVDAYLAGVPEPARAALQKVRAAIKAAAPGAVEGINWGMPGYKLGGYLGGFAAFKNHCSFFPGTTLEAFRKDLEGYTTTKGAIHFTPDHPLPAALVKKIVKARVKQHAELKAASKGKR
jgi:uncharacterized protein YdhG (YjbR/CyaY superfamily)